ncbi:MAG: metalloendopeptidase [Siphoviridae sp. ctpQM7]|nr:MAG: metalloendopeptidase [Siphoviridae sp. ctpQM7]
MWKFIAPSLAALLGISLVLAQEAPQPLTTSEKIKQAVQQGKTSGQRANIKALDILARQHKGIFASFIEPSVNVEILSVGKIDEGVEVMARAWKDGKPVGFGADGTVEIERFRFQNPPILVPDPLGNIERWELVKFPTGETAARYFREDHKEALRRAVADTIRIAGKDGAKVVPGKVGRTTSTFYPDANPETDTVDGYVYCTHADFSTCHLQTNGNISDDTGTSLIAGDSESGPNDNILRAFSLFKTSALGAGASISAATYSLYVTTNNNPLNDANSWLNVYSSTPASNTALVTEDFDQVGDVVTNPTKGSDSNLNQSAITLSAYNDLTLNATGRGWINKTGITKLGFRQGHDATNTDPAIDNTEQDVYASSADTAGTTQDPKLTVTYTSSVDAPVFFFLAMIRDSFRAYAR